jgi:hypothetical protein
LFWWKNFSEESFGAEGAPPFSDPEATARAETLAEGLAMAVGSAWSAQARVSGPKGRFPRFETLFSSPFFSLRLKNVVLLSAEFEMALDESVKNCKALAEAAERKEAERMAMSEAISAFCRAFGFDDVPSGSSPQSHLRALSGHVRSRLRGGADEEEAALAEVQRLDAAVEGPSAALASSFEVEVLLPVLPPEAGPDSVEGGNDTERAVPPPADV